jgi:secernin
MCDTIVALGSATKDGATLFGKNSDREPDEVQNVKFNPRREYKKGNRIRCTYMTIPQAAETAAVMLSQPFWMFGAEMGANEHGVVIGNEALFTREKPDVTGLTGMDLLRLALERGRTAEQALEVIIELLEKYGQGGNCGYRQKFFYMNSFLVADHKEAYVLETVKSWWAWKKVTDIWSISNVITLEQDYDACSPGLIDNAVKKGYCRKAADFNFRRCYSDKIMTWGAKSAPRLERSREMLLQKKGKLTTTDIMAVLRDHGNDKDWTPDKSGGTICMHAADKLLRRSQSVGSMAAKLSKKVNSYYLTGAANPCLSPYFPIFATGTTAPDGYIEGGADYDAASYWWECEKLHRKALCCYRQALDAIRSEIKKYEGAMISVVEGGRALNQKSIDKYFVSARDIVRDWGVKLDKIPEKKPKWLFRRYWQGYNKLNGI